MFGLEHLSAATARGRFVFLVMMMAGITAIALLEVVVLGSPVPLAAAAVGWAIVLIYGMVEGTLFERVGRRVASLTLPSGSATPSVNQHSDIEALVARGRLAEAAAAYRAAIAADPRDVLACDRLGLLALRELKDPELALFAARAGESAALEPRRKAGFALLAASILRDDCRDYGRAVVELRRILACYPDLPNAARLRAELDELKAKHFEAR